MEINNNFIEILSQAQHVTVLTGAGVSAESGIKTFRDPDGLWTKFNPQELASVSGFMANPKLVWDWYSYRRDIVNHAEPNPGHFALAEMEMLFPKFTLITQNVDRLHQRAGSTNVVELHGNIMENFCLNCRKPYNAETALPEGEIAKCAYCGGLIRPAVVWFGEMLPANAINAAYKGVENCDVLFSVGTSGEVYPAAQLPSMAKHAGAIVVEVNPNKTSISYYMDYVFNNPSGEVLPIIVEKIKETRSIK
jgi:NAD-dependent deacetylase